MQKLPYFEILYDEKGLRTLSISGLIYSPSMMSNFYYQKLKRKTVFHRFDILIPTAPFFAFIPRINTLYIPLFQSYFVLIIQWQGRQNQLNDRPNQASVISTETPENGKIFAWKGRKFQTGRRKNERKFKIFKLKDRHSFKRTWRVQSS